MAAVRDVVVVNEGDILPLHDPYVSRVEFYDTVCVCRLLVIYPPSLSIRSKRTYLFHCDCVHAGEQNVHRLGNIMRQPNLALDFRFSWFMGSSQRH